MTMPKITRRDALKVFSAGALASSLSACATMGQKSVGKVVVVGAGYGGATAAKYLRLWSDGAVDVTLVEPNEAFISCPMSNLVLGRQQDAGGHDRRLRGSGQVRRQRRARHRRRAIDVDKRQVRLASGATLPTTGWSYRPASSSCMTGCRGGAPRREASRTARVEGRAADGRAAPPADDDAGRRRGRDEHSAGAVPLPAGTVRARVPDRVVSEAASRRAS